MKLPIQILFKYGKSIFRDPKGFSKSSEDNPVIVIVSFECRAMILADGNINFFSTSLPDGEKESVCMRIICWSEFSRFSPYSRYL
jgi:hypothetical protein